MKETTKKGNQEEFNTKYVGTLDTLKSTEFFRAIQNKKNKMAFLQQLEQSNIAKAIVGVNFKGALVFEAKKVDEKYEYAASEIENPSAEALANCVNMKEFESIWA